MAKSTRGTKICVVKTSATGTSLTVTAATKAKPVELTATNTLANGNVIKIPAGSTGLPEIDGKSFVVANVAAGKFELLGSDATASTGTFLAGAAKPTAYAESDMECLCLSSMTFNRDTSTPASVATFCDPTATVPGPAAGAGTLDFGGYIDITDTDYAALLDLVDSGLETIWRVTLNQNGYVVFPAIVSQIDMGIPIEGAYTYSGTATLSSSPRHLF